MTTAASPSWSRVSRRRSRATACSSVSRSDLRLDPRLAEVVGVRGTAPQPEGVVEGADRLGRCEACGGVHGSFEAPGVDRVGLEAQDVPGPFAGEDTVAPAGHGLGLEAPSQVAHVRLEGAGGVRGWVVAPDVARETVVGDDLVAGDDQRRQDGTLTSPAEVDDRAVARAPQLAEHSESHCPEVRHAPTLSSNRT